MGFISDLDADALLDVMFGQVANPFPATYYIALSETEPANDGTGVTELVGDGYARASLANNTTSFPGASGRSTSIAVSITYPTASADWNEVGWFAIYDHATNSAAANFKGWGNLLLPIIIVSGATPYFAAGTLTINAPGV